MQHLTIFTPTYNRASLIKKLYISLSNQSVLDFEWLIVDDGSSDNTEEVVKAFIAENIIKIRFYKQTNSGKHIAINKGLEVAEGKLFFIVDSDDYLLEDAVEKILEKYTCIENNNQIAGLSFRRGYDNETPIGSQNFDKELICNVLDFRFRYKISGDMAEVIKTSVLRKYKFPATDEKFCPEALIWNRIGEKYSFYWIPEIVYIGEYLPDGLTSKIFVIRKKSPINTLTYYSELEKMNIPFIQKIKANINYWRFAKFSSYSISYHLKQISIFISILGFPLSLIFLLKDKN